MAFNPITNPIDYVLVANKRTPGTAEVVGASSGRKFDERAGIDSSGATLRFRGKKLARFSIKIRLADERDFDDWLNFMPVVMAMPDQALGLSLTHPILNDAGIRAGLVEEVVHPVADGDNGMWLVEIKMIEHSPRQPGVGRTIRGAATVPPGAAGALVFSTERGRQMARIETNNALIQMQNGVLSRYPNGRIF